MRSHVVFLFTSFIFASAVSAEEFLYYMNDGYKPVNMVKPDGVWINQKCANSKSDCPLYLTLPNAKEYRGKLAGNEAARYCHQVNGNSVILKDKNGGYYDFCHFENGDYLIDSWILVLKGK